MIDKSVEKRKSHSEIKLLLNYSHQLYQKYLESDKKFVYASILRKVNARLYERLNDSIMHLRDETYVDALEFMLHLDVWMKFWDAEYEKKKPQLWDAFTFHNDTNFPKSSVENLLLDLADFSE